MKTKLPFILFFIISISAFSQSKSQDIAFKWINNNKEKLKIQPGHDFEMLFKRESLSGKTFRYYQMINGVQVYDASIAVHLNKKDEVTYHSSTYDPNVKVINTTPNISKNDALQKTIAKQKIKQENITSVDNKLYVYNKLNETKLVYRLAIASSNKTGLWETIVDAHSGEVLSSKDIALYNNDNKNKPKKETTEKKNEEHGSVKSAEVSRANGTGFIFDTDPLTATTSAYGGNYSDNDDATNADLDAARTSVTLLDIEFSGGQYKLIGPYAEIEEIENPNKGLFFRADDQFNYNREEDGFEAVNVYYHLDKSLRYINNTLGITLTAPGGAVKFDPHGANGGDNSYYNGKLVFGEGCVDDGEDADVILHELGHGLHDWVTNGGLSNTQGLSEGFGDYWANSYKRNLGQWSSSDDAYSYVFGWDGHNTCWNGRSTSVTNMYPGGLGGGIHAEGQIIATVLMEIWEIIGRQKTDTAVLEGLGTTNSSTNQQDAAIAIRQAAIDMAYSCADINVFTERFEARGYTLPEYTCDLSIDDKTIASISIFPNPAQGTISFKNIKEDYNIEIYNMLGQIIKKGKVNSNEDTIDVSNLSHGTYFLRVKTINKVLKFIKI